MGNYDDGMRVRREVLGDEHVDRSMADATDLDLPFIDWITTNVWGDLWVDPTHRSQDTQHDHRSLCSPRSAATSWRCTCEPH